MRRVSVSIAIVVFLTSLCHAQDSQSLGDLARQVRAQKQQRDAQAKKPSTDSGDQDSSSTGESQPKASRVITNDDSPSTQDRTPIVSKEPSASGDGSAQSAANREEQGEHWKSQIQSQKAAITSLKNEITELSNSIRYAGANCAANCAKWNEHQQRKQEQVETMKAQLEEQQRRLEEMQEQARKHGFGSSVYDP